MNNILEVFQVQGPRIDLKIIVKKTKSLRPGISEGEEVMLGNDKIDQVDIFNYPGSFISKDDECVDETEDVKSRIT